MSLNNSNKNLLNRLEESSDPFESFSSSSNSNIYSSNLNSSNSNSWFPQISWITWILIIFVMAILGFNIFVYLAEGTEFIAVWSQKLVNLFNYLTLNITGTVTNNLTDTAKQTVEVIAQGATTGINVAANTITAGGTNLGPDSNKNNEQIVLPKNSNSTNSGSSIQNPEFNITDTNTNSNTNINNQNLNNALNDANSMNNVQPDDSYSSMQSSKTSGKAGWCFIGEDRGIRSCMKVGLNDTCMSGDIFPTNAVCVNPNLRA
jgi:hypothetical protein